MTKTRADSFYRDQIDLMERPFFALGKVPRTEPIQYCSGDGIEVEVSPGAGLGIATIYDADVLIWAASVITAQKNAGEEPQRTLKTTGNTLLRAIGRGTAGKDHARLHEVLKRLRRTSIATTIRADRKKQVAEFSWLDDFHFAADLGTGRVETLTITLSRWLFESITTDGGVLQVDPAYFDLTGATERWLYRVARKHAGHQPHGFTISMVALHHKSGTTVELKHFAAEIRKVISRNRLPSYEVEIQHRKMGRVVVMKPRKAAPLPH